MKLFSVLLLVTLASLPAAAQPNIQGIANAASYTVNGLPNAGVALGSMFVIFGTGLGPSTLAQVSAFPLPTTLAGTTVNINTVSFAGSVNAIMIYTSANQIAAIVPSSLNFTGNVVVTVSYNGQTSNTAFMKLTSGTFGAFTASQGGYGAAVAYNYNSASDQPLNTFATPAVPGQVVTLWGTGLGPVKGSEAAGPLPGQLSLNLQLYAGAQQVTPSYYGRSGCCVGIDQIVFAVPQGVTGCAVPISVVINGIVSNTSTIAVSPDGSACSDPLGTSSTDVQNAANNGATRFANITLTHTNGGNPPDSGAATFASTPFATYAATVESLPAAGSCLLLSGNASASGPPSAAKGLDAGPSIQVSGPNGAGQLAKTATGSYAGNLPAIGSGNYTVTGSGGSDVGPFSASLTIPGSMSWMTTAAVNPGSSLTVNWTASDPGSYISINLLAESNTGLFSLITCNQAASAGTLVVPGYLTAALPAGTGVIGVSQVSVPVRFSASGIDQGYFTYSIGSVSSTFAVGGGTVKE